LNVFLTGSTGYVGTVVAEKLQRAGQQIVALGRSDAWPTHSKPAASTSSAAAVRRATYAQELSPRPPAGAWGLAAETIEPDIPALGKTLGLPPLADDWALNSQSSSENTRRVLGWKPEHVQMLKEVGRPPHRPTLDDASPSRVNTVSS
jgi:hypothetical protein